MGTEQDGKERPRDSGMLAQPTTSHAQYTVTSHPATSLSDTQPQTIFEVVAGSSAMKPVQIITPMADSPASQHQFQYVVSNTNVACEDMDVENTLANIHNAPYIVPHQDSEPHRIDLPQLSSQTNHLFTITQDKSGEIGIQKFDVTLEKGEEKLLKKIAKTASIRPLKGGKDAAYASLDQEILEYMVRYESDEATKKITMRDLRHLIPLLIMRCYTISEEPYQRKVRGMWAEKPREWPEHIPYCDPNNKKNMGKPKKSTLLEMFVYLKNYYISQYQSLIENFKAQRAAQRTAQSQNCDLSVRSTATPSPALASMDAVSTITADMPALSEPSTALCSQTQTVQPMFTKEEVLHTSEPSLVRVPVSTITSFTELKQDWDPESDIIERIDMKMHILRNCSTIGQADWLTLDLIAGVLNKLYQVRTQDHVFFLEVSHDFEATLDDIKVTGAFPEKYRIRWTDFYYTHAIPDVACEQVLDITDDNIACKIPGIIEEDDVITAHNNLIISTQDRNSPMPYLNIYSSESQLARVDGEQVISDIPITSLQMTECDYANSTDAQPLPTRVPTPPSPPDISPYADDHDKNIYPLSSPYANEIFPDLYKDYLNVDLEDVTQSLDPSTIVMIEDRKRNRTSELIQQEEQTHLNINMNNLIIRKDSVDDGDKMKNMAHAFYNLKANAFQQSQPSLITNPGKTKFAPTGYTLPPPPLLTTGYNMVIPVVVEDMEDLNDNVQPTAKKRRTRKRPFPSSILSQINAITRKN